MTQTIERFYWLRFDGDQKRQCQLLSQESKDGSGSVTLRATPIIAQPFGSVAKDLLEPIILDSSNGHTFIYERI